MYCKIENVDKLFAKYKGKSVTVLWSGGLDSTFLIAMLIRAQAKDIQLLVIDYSNRPSVFQEKLARDLLLPAILEYAAGKTGIVVSTLTGSMLAEGWRYSQLAWWAHIAPLAMSPSSEYVLIGYVAGDRGPLYYNELNAFFKASHQLRENPTSPMPKLEFPLVRVEKDEIGEVLLDPPYDGIDRLFAAMRAYTHCCETMSSNVVPHVGPVCRCPSCNRHYLPNTRLASIGANADLSAVIRIEKTVRGDRLTWDMWLKMHPQYSDVCCYRKLVWAKHDGIWHAIAAAEFNNTTNDPYKVIVAGYFGANDSVRAELESLVDAKFKDWPQELVVGDFVCAESQGKSLVKNPAPLAKDADNLEVALNDEVVEVEPGDKMELPAVSGTDADDVELVGDALSYSYRSESEPSAVAEGLAAARLQF